MLCSCLVVKVNIKPRREGSVFAEARRKYGITFYGTTARTALTYSPGVHTRQKAHTAVGVGLEQCIRDMFLGSRSRLDDTSHRTAAAKTSDTPQTSPQPVKGTKGISSVGEACPKESCSFTEPMPR